MRSPKAKRPRCHECHGSGRMVRVMQSGGLLTVKQPIVCPRCSGSGREPRGA